MLDDRRVGGLPLLPIYVQSGAQWVFGKGRSKESRLNLVCLRAPPANGGKER